MDANPEKSQQSFDEWFTVKRDHKATGDLQLGFTFKAPDNESPDTELELGSKTIDLSRMKVGEEKVPFYAICTCKPESLCRLFEISHHLPVLHAG
jgi:hypothetical protein